MQRAGGRGVAEGQVVPGPAGAERLVGQRIIVGDEAAGDPPHAERRQPGGPVVEDARCAGALADGGIAVAGDDEIAAQDAVLEGAGGFDPGREARVPAEALSGDRERDHLHGRRRHHEEPRVALEEHLPGVERDDLGRPQRVDVPGVEDVRQPVGEAADGAGRTAAAEARLAARSPIRSSAATNARARPVIRHRMT